MHYRRARRGTRMDAPSLHSPLPERFWRKVSKAPDGACWEWLGSKNCGYGHIRDSGSMRKAHRVAYELVIGPIPEGLVIDHLCRNRACVNPSHLEPVSQKENIRRGVSVVAVKMALTHCPHGHPYSGENLYTNRRGWRYCRTCMRRMNRERKRRLRNTCE